MYLRSESYPLHGTGDWIRSELAAVDFHDDRLNRRLGKVASDLAGQPSDPINQASEDWAATKAAYRFFANPKVDSRAIASAHAGQTIERMRRHPVVLAIQDTTFLDYTAHPRTRGLGHIAGNPRPNQSSQGLVMHSTLAVTPRGEPLGLLHQQIWARNPEPDSVKKGYRKREPKKRESYKWIRALRRSAHRVKETSCQLVSVCDREGDFFELLAEAVRLKTHVLVRAHQDRVLEHGYAYREEEKLHLSEWLIQQPVQGHVKVHVPEEKHIHPSRQAILEARFGQVEFQAVKMPRWFQSKAEGARKILVSVIWLEEIEAPPGVKPIRWVLITTLPVKTLAQAIEKVGWYTCRWQIEVFHRILKSGCRVEMCRLEAADRLARYLTLTSVIAWRIHWMTYRNRVDPEAPCTTVLSDAEWKSLYCRIKKTRTLPKSPPSTYQAIRWIAQLGGFLGRKHDKEPGPTTIWRGWKRLEDIASAWELFAA